MKSPITTELFIERAKAVHGDKYDYSKSKYKNLRTKLVVICPIHGAFKQQPRLHLSGAGCRKCSATVGRKKNTLSNEEFIRRSVAIHQSKYDYTKSEYTGSNRHVTIICPEHGEFTQTPSLHLQGHGCKKCQYKEKSELMSLPTSEFLARAIECHGDRYDYSMCEYQSMNKYVYPICKIHERFKQRAINHTTGSGCPKCAVWSVNKAAEGYLYVLQSLCGKYIKIGVANNVSRRVAQYQASVPFPFAIQNSFRFERGGDAIQIESHYHSKFTSANLEGFDGATEWFVKDHKVLARLCNEVCNF